jgi:hypothetical protein
MVIRRVNPMSCAKVMGVIYAAIGLLIGLGFSLLGFLIGSNAGSLGHDTPFGGAALGAMFGVGAIVAMPILYGIMGVIGGALGALIYNVAAGAIGGIEIDVDTVGR